MRICIGLVLVSSVAAAQPAAEPDVLPTLYTTGNLRVAMACAETDATLARGLAVSVDGKPAEPLRVNGMPGMVYNDDGSSYAIWTQTDTGYLVAPGLHHVAIAAPGCAPRELDIRVAASHAELVTGRLEVRDPELRGPTGAPNGAGITLGALQTTAPRGPAEHSIGDTTRYTYDPAGNAVGGWLALTVERRGFAFALDAAFSTASASGSATGPNLGLFPQSPTTYRFSGSSYQFTSAVRFGRRIALDQVALAAGSGIGIETWMMSTEAVGVDKDTFTDPPDMPDASWYVPVWASATIKPACNWGFQVLASYDWHPTASDSSGATLAAGLILQPSAACSEPASVRVSPL
jgi:hypothetical protein